MFDEGDMTDFQSATLGFSFTDDDYEDESFDDFEDDEISDSLDDFDDDFYEEESFESLEEDDDIQEPFDDVEAEDGYDLSSHKPYDSGIDFEDF
ncbi:MAG: hypothetical protein PUK76_07525 [Treponema sp.]|nr:hypothetical protein [Treponema sp.]MDY2923655.1 hypothetical protein [Treponema sp.]